MHHFVYCKGVLNAEDVPLPEIARDVGTPFYCYSSATLTRHYLVFREALKGLDATICFAMKANSNLAVLRTLADLGAGCDVVSGGEFEVALRAGMPAAKIVFSGVGKTEEEIRLAISRGVGQINVESAAELDTISRIASSLGRTVRIALRVNPDVAAGGHDKISTGRKEDKFGIDWSQVPDLYRKARTLPGVAATAIAVHIGSQITTLAPFEAAFTKVRDLTLQLRAEGFTIDHLDLGGGLGVPYDHLSNTQPPSPAEYGDMVRRVLGGLGCKLAFEPGRVIVGNAGVMVAKVIVMKDSPTKKFVVIDAAMNDLVRPAMYGARHEILPVVEPPMSPGAQPVDVVGPICETSDRFAQDCRLPPLKAGDLIAFMTAGAYGSAMSSTYNSRPLIPEVLVQGARYAVVRRRPSIAEMLALEQLPSWLADEQDAKTG
ncbi:MAG: diaminopimelate decarboxylase [Rhodospirillaceae bacterium]|nr:diaminopimelate decarboxylase [Rhodospirillaceae bacterium]